MGTFSVQFSSKIMGKNGLETRRFPHDLKGQNGTVAGADPGAVRAMRNGQVDGKDMVMTKAVGKAIAREIADGARVSAYEKPVYFAAIAAAKGKDVFVTDATGHWRKLTATEAGAHAFFMGVKGVKIQKN